MQEHPRLSCSAIPPYFSHGSYTAHSNHLATIPIISELYPCSLFLICYPQSGSFYSNQRTSFLTCRTLSCTIPGVSSSFASAPHFWTATPMCYFSYWLLPSSVSTSQSWPSMHLGLSNCLPNWNLFKHFLWNVQTYCRNSIETGKLIFTGDQQTLNGFGN